MKTLSQILFVLICLAPGVSVEAQTAESAAKEKKPPITAEEVLERNIAAIGGRPAIEKSTSYCLKATLEMHGRGALGTLEVCGKAPDKLLVLSTIDRVGVMKQGYDGKTGWSQDPYQGLRILEGAELEKLRLQAIFNAELTWRELFARVELTGMEKVGEKEAYVVRLTGKDGFSVTRYYDTATFLLLRADAVDEGPQGRLPVETRYSDYRDLDGVKVAHQWTQKMPMTEIVFKITEAKNNTPIDDARFAKPSNANP
ncbi:MAG: hypothetical protein AABN33_19885 [Acidobacteriota bacterium]